MHVRATPAGGLLWPSMRALQIWGANAGVGKTVMSIILCVGAGHRRPREGVHYLKPVSTCPQTDSETLRVRSMYSRLNTAGKKPEWFDSESIVQYPDPVSPHIAVEKAGLTPISDAQLLAQICSRALKRAGNLRPQHSSSSWLFCETSGGVHSPSPSGTSQADLYRPLRLPAILIGDPRLGGISATVTAFESLRLRGYDVEAILMLEDEQYRNHEYLASYFQEHRIPFHSIRHPPPHHETSDKDRNLMFSYYDSMARSRGIQTVLRNLASSHSRRIKDLDNMAKDAHKTIWYPFTQQKLLTADDFTTIDSAYGDYFQTYSSCPEPRAGLLFKDHWDFKWEARKKPSLRPCFDASASWWTQGLGHGNPRLTLAAAYAAGRYGHVMLTEAVIHEPALKLAKLLLRQLGNPRLSRVFYSDNGSTGIEVAVKMALRAARLRYGWGPRDELSILGLKGSYHGDTIGAMDCSEPGAHNEKTERYKGKGYWFDVPKVKMTNGEWKIELPAELCADGRPTAGTGFGGLDELFNLKAREGTELYRDYTRYITRTLEGLREEGYKFGALMLEPVVLGAGGMVLADPLFQQALVDVVRSNPKLFSESAPALDPEDETGWKGLPVVFDEVLTGLYRLGSPSSASFLNAHPDITVHAELLTGGHLPLAVTVASESIFRSFESDDKSDALLHGHSYTAHAVGCQVAIESLETMKQMEESGAWQEFQADWARDNEVTHIGQANDEHKPAVWSVWGRDFVGKLSARTDQVDGVWALGSVLAIHFKDAESSGYESNASRALQAELMAPAEDILGSNVHSRVLGNVIYLITSQTTSVKTVRRLEKRLLRTETLGSTPGVDAMDEDMDDNLGQFMREVVDEVEGEEMVHLQSKQVRDSSVSMKPWKRNKHVDV